MSFSDRFFDIAELAWKVAPRRFRHLLMSATQTRFLVGVVGAIYTEDERVLLLEHRFRIPSPWGLPGGFLERGETAAAGLVRELKEETGLTIRLDPTIRETLFNPEDGYATLALAGCVDQTELSLSREIKSGCFCPVDQILPETYAPHADLLRRWGTRPIADLFQGK